MNGMKFVRIHGRVVPISGKGSAPAGVSKRYGVKRQTPRAKKVGIKEGALNGAGLVAIASLTNRFVLRGKSFGLGALAAGAVVGGVLGSMKSAKRGKGESNKQLARRMSGKNKSGV